MGNPGRIYAFWDAHIGFGIRWQESCYYTGTDISVALLGFTVVVSTGKEIKRC